MPRKSRIRRKGNRRRTVRRKKIRGGNIPCPFVTNYNTGPLKETDNKSTIYLEKKERLTPNLFYYNVYTVNDTGKKTLRGEITDIQGDRAMFGAPQLEPGEYTLISYELIRTGPEVGRKDYSITIEPI
jgi:hypothetical protein